MKFVEIDHTYLPDIDTCVCCGGEPVLITFNQRFTVVCPICNVHGPVMEKSLDAVNHWNVTQGNAGAEAVICKK